MRGRAVPTPPSATGPRRIRATAPELPDERVAKLIACDADAVGAQKRAIQRVARRKEAIEIFL